MNRLKLHAGDHVAIVATARCINHSVVKSSIKLFESWGLVVDLAEGLFEKDNYFAGTDEHRTSSFQKMLDDDAVKAIVCACGGYGTVRMVDGLNFDLFMENPKMIVGFSDVTVLHSHVARHCSVPTLHATMPINVPGDAVKKSYASTDSLRKCMFDDEYSVSFQAEDESNREGECDAQICGGNLSVLYSLLGSSSDIDTDGKILMIEDLDEYLYHVDRMVMALKRAGKFARLKGLLVGAMTSMHDTNTSFGHSVEEIVRNAVSEYGYPVAYHCPFGHIGVKNVALPLGRRAHLKVGKESVEIDF